MTNARQVFWLGRVPSYCQVSGTPITDEFVDGRSANGQWAIMHPETFAALGHPFGPGFGQKYKKQSDGKWLKVAG